MKKKLKNLIVLALILVLAGCSQSEINKVIENPKANEKTIENISEEDMNKILEEIGEDATNKISYKWTEILMNENEDDKNLVISPLGINRSMKILLSGIGDKNKIMELYENSINLEEKYKNTNSESEVLINKDLGFILTDEAQKDKKVKSVEFPKEATAEKIELQKRVLEEVMNSEELSEDLAAVIMDATRFKINWEDEYKFSKDLTKKEIFMTAKNERKMAQTMNKYFDEYAYVDDEGEVIKLSGGDEAEIYFIRPKENPKEFSKRLEEYVKKYDEERKKYSIELHLPKVEFYSNIEGIQENLKYFGMDNLNQGFYLDKIIKNAKEKDPLAISDFIQNAYLKIDEEGAEAKAYTEMKMELTALMPDELEELVLKYNSPYYIVIKDKAENSERWDVVFTAYVADPTEK